MLEKNKISKKETSNNKARHQINRVWFSFLFFCFSSCDITLFGYSTPFTSNPWYPSFVVLPGWPLFSGVKKKKPKVSQRGAIDKIDIQYTRTQTRMTLGYQSKNPIHLFQHFPHRRWSRTRRLERWRMMVVGVFCFCSAFLEQTTRIPPTTRIPLQTPHPSSSLSPPTHLLGPFRLLFPLKHQVLRPLAISVLTLIWFGQRLHQHSCSFLSLESSGLWRGGKKRRPNWVRKQFSLVQKLLSVFISQFFVWTATKYEKY